MKYISFNIGCQKLTHKRFKTSEKCLRELCRSRMSSSQELLVDDRERCCEKYIACFQELMFTGLCELIVSKSAFLLS